MENTDLMRYLRQRQIALAKPLPRPQGFTHLEEIADLLDQIYTTLAKMTYIPHTAIKRGPHTLPASVTEKYHLDPTVVKLMEIMPYVDKAELEPNRVVFGGLFADYRKEEDVSASREPFYCNWAFDEAALKWRMNGPEYRYMLPWITPLTLISGRPKKRILLYNARYNCLYTADMTHWASRPAMEGEGFRAWWDETEELLDLQEDPHRFPGVGKYDAKLLLKMHLDSLAALGDLPWEIEYDEDEIAEYETEGEDKFEALVDMYRDNGWPDDFDEDQFQADFIRWSVKLPKEGDPKSLYEAILKEEGEERMEEQTGGVWADELPPIQREALEGKNLPFPKWTTIGRLLEFIEEAEVRLRTETDVDAIWRDKFSLYQNKRLLAEAEAHLNELHEEYERARSGADRERTLQRCQAVGWELENIERRTKEEREKFTARDFPDDTLELRTNWLAQRERELKWYTMAYKDSMAEMREFCRRTGAKPLPTGNEKSRAIGSNQNVRQKIAKQKEYLAEMKAWLSDIPAEATETKWAIDKSIKEVESEIQALEHKPKSTEDKSVEQGPVLFI